MRLTPEVLFGPTPTGPQPPTNLKLAPDGRHGSYLRTADDDRYRLELWLVDMTKAETWRLLTGKEKPAGELTAQERGDRERRRMFSHGVTSYEWHPDGDHLLVPAAGAAYLVSVEDGSMRPLTAPDTHQTAFRLSPKGAFLSFVRDGDLYARHLANGVDTRLTTDGGGTIANGLAGFIAQEEMGRHHGHWWAPDESAIAFTRVDEAPIPETHRYEFDGGGPRTVAQRYPFAGGRNAEVRLGLVDVANGETTWLNWALSDDDYLARVDFAPDGALYAQAQSRDQRRLALRRYADGEWRQALVEQATTWLNLHDNLKFLPDGRFLWTSEPTDESLDDGSGRSRLWLCDDRPTRPASDDGARRQDAGSADRVLAATDTEAWVTRGDDPGDGRYWRNWLCRRSLAPADPARQSATEPSTSARDADAVPVALAAFCARSRRGLVVTSSSREPPRLGIVDSDLHVRPVATPKPRRVFDIAAAVSLGTLFVHLDNAPHTPQGWSKPLRLRHRRLGLSSVYLNNIPHTPLYYRLTKPSSFDPNRRYPVIVLVYGGPGTQLVRDEFPPLPPQLFAQAGFGVFELDNRGSANRGKAFEDPIHRRLGHAEVADQLAGVEFLRQQPWVDSSRIGIHGHSYGGYMVLMCLAQSHVFAAGVSIAPVTDWRFYDTHYTERYLGAPAENPDGYQASGVLPRVKDIDAPLLLMHGMADDNVLFLHSAALMKALRDAAVPFELMTYPFAKHSLQQPAVAIDRYRQALDFFRRKLAD